MTYNLFEGLDDGLLLDTQPQDHGPAGSCWVTGWRQLNIRICCDNAMLAATAGFSRATIVGSCGFRQVLLHDGRQAPLALLAFTASGEQQGQQQTDCRSILLEAQSSSISRWEQISGRSQLLRVCQQPAAGCDSLGASYNSNLQACCLPCCLLLCKSDSTLQLLAIDSSQKVQTNQQQLQQPLVRLLAEFEHDSFQQLEQQQCWLAAGPLLLLQPEPEQLLLIAPAADAAAASAGAGACGSAGAAQDWQLLELDLPEEQLLACLHQEHLASMIATRAAADVPLQISSDWQQHLQSSSSNGLQHVASGPLQVLHVGQGMQGSSSVQLLVSLPVAAAPTRARMGSAQQSLLFWIEVHVSSSDGMAQAAAAAAGIADGVEIHAPTEGLHIMCCYALGWQESPACAAVGAGCASSAGAAAAGHAAAAWQQHVALGSSSGDVQLLQVCSRQLSVQQLQLGQLVSHSSGSSSSSSLSCMHQAAGRVPGPVTSIAQLAAACLAGAVQHDVLAVLHDVAEQGASTVSLLVQQGEQLQVVATVQGAAALLTPSCSPVGLLCPWQQQQVAVQSAAESTAAGGAVLDSNALQLAALIILDSQHTAQALDKQDSQQALHATGLDCYAWLPAGSVHGQLPGSVVGLLRCLPLNLHAAAAAATAAGSEAERQAATGSWNELRGLQAMLAALEARWQQGAECCKEYNQYKSIPYS
jgi:hypothetical protein